MAARIRPQDVKEYRNDEVSPVIQNRCRALIAQAEVLSQHGRGEGNRTYTQQKQQIQEKERVVGTFDVSEQAMVIDPHNPNKSEAYDECNIRWPLLEELSSKISAASAWDLDFQNEQSDGNREHTIREGFDARSFFFHGEAS